MSVLGTFLKIYVGGALSAAWEWLATLWNDFKDSFHKRTSWLAVLYIVVITAVGFVYQISAASVEADFRKAVIKQALLIFGGTVAAVVISRIRVIRISYRWMIIAVCVVSVLMLGYLFFQNRARTGDPQRWIGPEGIQFQPSEIAKMMVIILGAYLYSKYYDETLNRAVMTGRRSWPINDAFARMYMARHNLSDYNQVKRWVYPLKVSYIPFTALGVYIILCVGLMSNNHLSGLIIVGLLGVVMYFFGRVRARYFIAGIILVAMVFAGVIARVSSDVAERDAALERVAGITLSEDAVKSASVPDSYDSCVTEDQVIEVYRRHIADFPILSDYQAKRIYLWIDKDYDDYAPVGDATNRQQINKAVYAVASGGFFGKGFGNSLYKHWSIASQTNDEIFAVICEEGGMFVGVFFMVMYLLLVKLCFSIGDRADNVFSSLIAKGVGAHIGIQAFLNIFVALDAMPNTGISLPFVSSGGSSILFLFAEVGLLLSVARFDRRTTDEENN